MPNIIEQLSNIDDIFYVGGCSESQSEEVQIVLGGIFSAEYINYIKKFGCISFGSVEWTGLNIVGRLNIVTATEKERALNPNFPQNVIVLENLGIDAKLIIVDEKGHVYLFQKGSKKLVAKSLSEYLLLRMD